MVYQYDAAIIGGDLRQSYLALILKQSGFKVIAYGLDTIIHDFNLNITDSAKYAIASGKTIIAPIPISRDKKYITGLDVNNQTELKKLSVEKFLSYLQPEHYLIGGNISGEVIDYCNKLGIGFFDLMKNDDIALLNAVATAEGAIAEAIIKSSGNLHQSKGLVLGYGRCGKVLSAKLHNLGMHVTVAARNNGALLEAYTNCLDIIRLYDEDLDICEFDFIFNTIPAQILDKSLLLNLSPDAVVIDIASAPGGVDYEAARELKLNVHSCLGIPGKIAPKASAKILAGAIIPILKERSD